MIINEIFKSIDGESRRAGEIATFIRSSGCCLRCSYCDSKYTWEKEETCQNMTVDEIVAKCKELGARNITFTGGEPLIQKDADELIEKLAAEGFDVSIETCGAIDFSERPWFKKDLPNVWVCADYKGHTSGEQQSMLSIEVFEKLRSRDVIKFVVGNQADLVLAHTVIEALKNTGTECYAYLSPVFGEIAPVDIVEYMLEHDLQDKVRFQLQLHKFVWPPEMRGV